MKKFRTSLAAAAALVLLVGASFLIPAPSSAQNGNQYRSSNNNYGVSGGNINDISRQFCCSGTLGSLVTDGTTQYILSNNHVLGLADRAQPGDDVSQPGRIDANCGVTEIVADFTVAPALTTGVDAAIAQLRTGAMNSTGAIEGIGAISSTVRAPSVGLAVQKSGRTTGHTTGSVSSISTTVSIRYPKSCGGGGGTARTFTNQVVINSTTFSAGGDSGSLIVTNDSAAQPVALLFAGSSSSTIGNPISLVLSRVSTALGRTVSFVGTPTPAAQSLGFSIAEDGTFMQELPEVAANAASRVLAVHEADLMSRPGVIGVGVGQGSQDKSEAVIVLYINKSERTDAKGLPKVIDGVRVRRVFTDEFVAR